MSKSRELFEIEINRARARCAEGRVFTDWVLDGQFFSYEEKTAVLNQWDIDPIKQALLLTPRAARMVPLSELCRLAGGEPDSVAEDDICLDVPVLVMLTGTGTPPKGYLIDGYHRLGIAWELGFDALPAIYVTPGGDAYSQEGWCDMCFDYDGICCTSRDPKDGRSSHEPSSHPCPRGIRMPLEWVS